MRIAILSDIHANIHALEAVANDLREQGIQSVWSLGDVVGYGAHPRECVQWVQERAEVVVKGNHDEAVATGDVTWFNPMAAQAARLHAQKLTPPERALIYGWPTTVQREVQGRSTLIVHASPDDPLHEYVQPQDARLGLRRWEGRARLILLGHTHRPFAARLDDGGDDPPSGTAASGPPGARPAPGHAPTGAGASSSARDHWRAVGFHETLHDKRATAAPLLLVNPGSVGQPRDGDPRAAYAIVDFAERIVELRRVTYDVEAAAQAILKEGLDHLLALRLYEGR